MLPLQKASKIDQELILNPSDVVKYKEALLEKQVELVKALKEHRDGILIPRGLPLDQADTVQERGSRLTNSIRLEMLSKESRQVSLALKLIETDQGSYGTCRICGKEISRNRLDALPWATECIKCASVMDHRSETNALRGGTLRYV